MHEFSLASEILEAARESLSATDGVESCLLRVRVGQLSGVNADSLRFCLEAAHEAGTGPAMEIEVEQIRASLVCPACGEVECENGFDTACPRCGGTISGVVGGREFEVELELDGDDAAEDASGED